MTWVYLYTPFDYDGQFQLVMTTCADHECRFSDQIQKLYFSSKYSIKTVKLSITASGDAGLQFPASVQNMSIG